MFAVNSLKSFDHDRLAVDNVLRRRILSYAYEYRYLNTQLNEKKSTLFNEHFEKKDV